VIQRPAGMGAYQFVVIATKRAAQLMRGCTPRVDPLQHKPITVAQMEVSEGKVGEAVDEPATPLPVATVLEP
jgi:DNA-directed RNA polymerase omega subunit